MRTKQIAHRRKVLTSRGAQSFGQKLIAGLAEFDRALKSGRPIGDQMRVKTVRVVGGVVQPSPYGADEVKATRELLHASQAVFAELVGVSIHAVQSWEQGKQEPTKIVCRILDEMRINPRRWRY